MFLRTIQQFSFLFLLFTTSVQAQPEFSFSMDFGGSPKMPKSSIGYSVSNTIDLSKNPIRFYSLNDNTPIVKEVVEPAPFGLAGIIRSTFSELLSTELRLGYYGVSSMIIFNETVSADYYGEDSVTANTSHKFEKHFFDIGLNGLFHYGFGHTIFKRKGITFAPMLIAGGGVLLLAKGEQGYCTVMPDSKEGKKAVSAGSLDYNESFKLSKNAYYLKIGGGTELMVNIVGIYFRAGITKFFGNLFPENPLTYITNTRSLTVSYPNNRPLVFDLSGGLIFYLN